MEKVSTGLRPAKVSINNFYILQYSLSDTDIIQRAGLLGVEDSFRINFA